MRGRPSHFFEQEDDADAEGGTSGSPGVVSGNNVEVPVDVPVNTCGNYVDVVSALNPAFANSCARASSTRQIPPRAGLPGASAPRATTPATSTCPPRQPPRLRPCPRPRMA
ncbi:chaplin [Streptomyces sp. NPDC005209]|uniref:chaplin n=1 Tax=Streptomyces sp. NPDC005209 TaxID=3156715 RepID=UPI0033A83E0B